MEPYPFIEAAGILLGLDVNLRGPEVADGGLDGMEHYLAAITTATLRSDDTADGDLLHVGSGRADPGKGYYAVTGGEPEMDGGKVIIVKILIDAVLLYNEHRAAHLKEAVELCGGQGREGFNV